MSKLDAAIEGMTIFEAVERVRAAILREPHLSFLESTVPPSIRRLDDRALEIIVPILEAVAKVDREPSLIVLKDIKMIFIREGRLAFIGALERAIALLEALPDEPTPGPGKEKK